MQSGYFTCRSMENKSHAETLRIFTQRSEQAITAGASTFVSVGQLTIQSDVQGNNFIVPCRSNYRVESPPKLLLVRPAPESKTELTAEEMKSFRWDPSVGFQFNRSREMWEMQTLVCFHYHHHGSSYKMFRPTPSRFEDSIFVKTKGHQIRCGFGKRNSTGLKPAQHKSKYQKARYHGCSTYLECDLNLESGMHLGRDSYREYFGDTFSMQMLDLKKTFGVLSCRLEHSYNGTTVPEISSRIFFLGLDSNVYLLPGSYPNSSIIQISPVDGIFYKSQRELYHEFICTTIDFMRSSAIYFILRHTDMTEIIAQHDNRRPSSEQSSESLFNVTLHTNITHAICLIITTEGKFVSAERPLEIVDASAPEIENATKKSRTLKAGDVNHNDLTLTCPITGVPPPMYRWVLHEKVADAKLVHGVNTRNLTFRHIHEIVAGNYTCKAWNQFGTNSFVFQVSIQPQITAPPQVNVHPPNVELGDSLPSQELSSIFNGTTIGWISFAIVLCIILSCAVIVLAIKYARSKKKIRNLTPEEALDFLNGIPISENVSHDDGCELALNLPFTKRIESESLVVVRDAILGKGQYGIVYRGLLHDEAVAVKTFKHAVTYDEFRAGLIEVKLMHFVGDHPNIVRFIGADVANIENCGILVVMELSPIGSLEKHLRRLKPSVYANYVGTKASQYAEVDDRLIYMTLLGFCEQIAFAMEHLESKKVIHGDLAARNVLVFSHGVVKVTDFGYSRQLYDYNMYRPKKNRALPWRWASIELLRQMEFSTESDIWAFGVTVWEIFTFGNLPFPSEKWNEHFMESLDKGLRLKKPLGLSVHQYSFLKECWNLEKSARPKFSALTSFFSKEKDSLGNGFKATVKVLPHELSLRINV